MKNIKNLLLVAIMLVIMLSSCASKDDNSGNSKYTYGTLQNEEIESVYELVGSPSKYMVNDFSGGVSNGSKGSYYIQVCETASGGVVAYSEEMYIYSPDKNDADDVKNALISECMKNQ